MQEIGQRSHNIIQIHGLQLNHPIRVQVPYSKINILSGKATPRLRKVYTHILEIKLNMSRLNQTRENLKKREARNAYSSVEVTIFHLASKHLAFPSSNFSNGF